MRESGEPAVMIANHSDFAYFCVSGLLIVNRTVIVL
jgi:hypothetical protein